MNPHSTPNHEPTPEEIQSVCAEIRKTWNRRTERTRTVTKTDAVEVQVVSLVDPNTSEPLGGFEARVM